MSKRDAFKKASGHRIGEDSVDCLVRWMPVGKKSPGKPVNRNKKLPVRLMNKVFGKIADTTAKKKAAGE